MKAKAYDTLISDAVNRAFGAIVNEMRIVTLRDDLDSLKETYPISQLIELASQFAAGLDGHAPGSKTLPRVTFDPEFISVAIEQAAPAWNATVDGETVTICVDCPIFSEKIPKRL